FNIIYRDDRSSTRTSLGDRLLIDGLGGSLVGVYPAGPGELDVLAWVAYEFGDFGAMSHRAIAVIGEGGYGWPQARLAPWVRGGVAYASGDSDPADQDHGTFFNMVPTNHKFYGDQDLSALQNLTNVYGQLRLQPHRLLALSLEGHLFRLSDAADAWYGGSGPANNQGFGYVARFPGGRTRRDIGTEWDLILTWSPRPILGVQVGAAYFKGGEVAEALFPVEDNSTWLYVQAVLTR
ncbi:MAG: alginate export family protein, partial [Vicinamibacteria bacterium]